MGPLPSGLPTAPCAGEGLRAEPPRVLYLLDEILQGTNTAERQIAARRVIRLLLRCRSIGAVSTHDLTLAEGPELAAATVPVHLREYFGEENGQATMTFDYKLRPGLATSTNALKLMEIVFEHRGRIARGEQSAVDPAT